MEGPNTNLITHYGLPGSLALGWDPPHGPPAHTQLWVTCPLILVRHTLLACKLVPYSHSTSHVQRHDAC